MPDPVLRMRGSGLCGLRLQPKATAVGQRPSHVPAWSSVPVASA
jgi:hypothetical protein